MLNLSPLDIIYLLLGIATLLLLARKIASLSGKFGIPPVMSEIFLGILLGPTFLVTVSPEVSAWLFPTAGEAGMAMQQLSHFSLMMLLFIAGMETDLKVLQEEGGKVALTALGSMAFPFLTGFMLVWLNPTLFGVNAEHHLTICFFMGIALAISALPVIIRILMDLDLYRSKVGIITVGAASLMDIVGWIAFALILAYMNPLTTQDLPTMLWSHSTLLSFIAGIVVGNSSLVPVNLRKRVFGLVITVLSPIFFLSIGAKVNFATNLDVVLIAVVILAATISKVTGTLLSAKMSGLNTREAITIGIALNARGAMEIILSKQALEAGLIEHRLFVALVIMALFTSMFSAPAIRFLVMNLRERKTLVLPIVPSHSSASADERLLACKTSA